MKMRNKIGTWNVRTLYAANKFTNVIKEMKRLQIDIIGISKTRWLNSKLCHCNEIIFYLDTDERKSVPRSGILN